MMKPLDVPRNEIYRYLGYKGAVPDERTSDLAEDCIKEIFMQPSSFSVESRTLAIDVLHDSVSFRKPGSNDVLCVFESGTFARHLSGCDRAVVFAATLGQRTDDLIDMYSKKGEITRAVVLQACGAAAIETLCDDFTAGLDISCSRS